MREIIESLGLDYREYLKVYRRLWNRLHRKPQHPDKKRAASLRYMHRHRAEIVAYKRGWNKSNGEKLQSLKIKHGANLPLYRVFVELDALHEFESFVINEAKTPLELLIEKEEYELLRYKEA